MSKSLAFWSCLTKLKSMFGSWDRDKELGNKISPTILNYFNLWLINSHIPSIIEQMSSSRISSVTHGLPSVKVPVLSNTTVFILKKWQKFSVWKHIILSSSIVTYAQFQKLDLP
jgi:hypothetical protein